MIQQDNRLGGVPYYILTDTPQKLMMIPDSVRDCSVFIGPKGADGLFYEKASAFIVAKPIPDHAESCLYIVTAKHNIDKIKDAGSDDVGIRINHQNGSAQWLNIPTKNWLFHPVAEDEIDVAAASISLPKYFNYRTLLIASFATKEIIQNEAIGIGNTVFLVGLFYFHKGKEKNIPIIRVGNIAAMPEEKVYTDKFGWMDAYLIESRSVGGLSGSPVFVHLDLMKPLDSEGHSCELRNVWGIYLLGLMHGHWDAKNVQLDIRDDDEDKKINSGIAIVVPASIILEVLDHPHFKEQEAQIKKRLDKEMSPTMDSITKVTT